MPGGERQLTGIIVSSTQRFTHLKVSGISKSFGHHRVFTDISFSVAQRERVGVIGENGSGKSTLLRLLAGELTPDTGSVETLTSGGEALNVGFLRQQPQFIESHTVAEVLEHSVQRLRCAQVDVEAAAQAFAVAPEQSRAMNRYVTALDTAELLGAWDIDSRIETTVHGLGLGDLIRHHTVANLSGGQRARLALASLLLSRPDILLLDEPTNHLDDEALAYLTAVLTAWHGPVMIVSHDRAFLDETVDSILDLDPAPQTVAAQLPDETPVSVGVTRFSGSYSEYLRFRQQARQRWEHQYRREQDELKRLRTAIEHSQTVGHSDWKPRTESRSAKKFYADRNAKVVSRRVNDARTRLAEAERRQLVQPPSPLTFQGLDIATTETQAQKPGPEWVVRAKNIGVASRLQPISFTIETGDHLLLTGANGTGKSTLLQVLAGELLPTHGQLERTEELTYRILRQESTWGEQADLTARVGYEQAVGIDRADTLPLATYGLLSPQDEHRPIATLSVGQQRRLDLAVLLAHPTDVLLLDEPTNHLSLLLVTELELSLGKYPGTVIVATHDRWLRERWHGKQLHLHTKPL